MLRQIYSTFMVALFNYKWFISATGVELQNAALLISNGIWLMLPMVIINLNTPYWFISTVINLRILGAVYVATGILQIVGITCHKVRLRRWILLFIGWLWATLLCLLIVTGNFYSMGVPLYAVFTVTTFKSFFSLRGIETA